MPMRDMIVIDEEKCNGCGLCVPACAEGALQIIDGKARVMRDDFCDGLGACLGHCPQGALTIEKREAPEFDEEAALAHVRRQSSQQPQGSTHGDHGHSGCPGARMMHFAATPKTEKESSANHHPTESTEPLELTSALRQWPVELSLLSPNAPYFQGADLLLCADCVPFAYGDFHRQFLSGRAVAVGCPKLDDASEYVAKLADIIARNNLRRLTIVHMEVPCCSGLVYIAKQALELSGQTLPVHEFTIGIDGSIKEERKRAAGF